MYFSVRNYWRGFFAAACGATVFRILRVSLDNESKIESYIILFKKNEIMEFFFLTILFLNGTFLNNHFSNVCICNSNLKIFF